MNTQLDRVEKGEERARDRETAGEGEREDGRESLVAHPERFLEIGDRKDLGTGEATPRKCMHPSLVFISALWGKWQIRTLPFQSPPLWRGME